MQITRKLEFDAGHRIPNHQSQCRHVHGHRYVLEITVEGDIIQTDGSPSEGMVLDFSEVKHIAFEHLVQHWDHAFLVYEKDKLIVDFLKSIPEHKTVTLNCVPTVENLARTAFNILQNAYIDHYGNHLRLLKIRLYETPNCWAEAFREE
jgi:6-pyruvoyltetrahydropterin/6-carboxytetrahydropterin synthase